MSATKISSTAFSLKMRTALMGSPTYFGFPKPTVLTRPPFFTSRHGITLGRSMGRGLQCSEILEQAHAPLMALLGMKLHAQDVARANSRSEATVVIRHCEHVGRVGRLEI